LASRAASASLSNGAPTSWPGPRARLSPQRSRADWLGASGLDWRTWAGNEIDATTYFRTSDPMIHKTGGPRAWYCRVLIDAYGVVPSVERDYAFSELVVQGETAFMPNDSEEMSYYASWLAFHPEVHRRMAENDRRHLEETLVNAEASCSG
jgi:hypothetical protein